MACWWQIRSGKSTITNGFQQIKGIQVSDADDCCKTRRFKPQDQACLSNIHHRYGGIAIIK